MGENAFIAFGLSTMLVLGQPISWQQRLGAVFVAGIAFLVITLLGTAHLAGRCRSRRA